MERMTRNHVITSPLSRGKVSARTGKGRPVLARMFPRILLVLGMLFPMFAVAATNANPASADIGIPDWVAPVLTASAAVASVGVNATKIAVTDAVAVTVSGGSQIAAAAGSASLNATDFALWTAEMAAPYAGDVAAGSAAAGVCAGTAGIACVVGGTAAAAAGAYMLYRFFCLPGVVSPKCGNAVPNSDVTVSDSVSYSSNWTITGFTLGTNPSISFRYDGTTNFNAACPPQLSAASWNSTVGVINVGNSVCSVSPGGTGTINVPAYQGMQAECVELDYGTFNTFGWGGSCPAAGGTNIWGHSTNTTVKSNNAGDPTPDRTLVTTRHCTDASGNITTVTGTGPPFKEAANVAALASYPACPAGTSVKDSQTVSHTTNGTAPDKSVTQYTAPPSVVPGTDPVPLSLVQVQPDGSTQPCEQTPSPCANWYESPQKDQTYKCMQGTVVLTLADCEGLRYRYNPPIPSPKNTGRNCFDGMGISPLTWPKGLVLSPLKCLFIPSDGAMTKWMASITALEATPLVSATSGIIGWVKDTIQALADDNNGAPVACPSDDNGGGPIHWCQIVKNAGDMMTLTPWGQGLFMFAKIVLYLYFGLLWYNRITATLGAKGDA